MRFYPAAVILVLLLQACASGPAPVAPDAPQASRGSPAGETPAMTTPDNGATSTLTPGPADSLLVQARRLRREGDLEACFVTLDRALRIAPQNAEVYLEFARTYTEAGNTEQAAASAQRGLLYCRGSVCRTLLGFADK